MRARHLVNTALLGAVLGITAAASLPAAVIPAGEVFRLDAAPDCSERNPDAAPLPGGGFVAAWIGAGVQARVYDAAGTPAGAAFPVDTPNGPADAISVAVAAGPDGRFLAAWNDAARDRTLARLFSADGTPLGAEIGLSSFAFLDLDAVALPGGGFAVILTGDSGIFLHLLDEEGDPDFPLTFVEAYSNPFGGPAPEVHDPAIAVRPDGDLVTVWTVSGSGFTTVEGRIIPTIGGDAWSRLETTGVLADPWVADPTVGVDASGNIVVAWTALSSEDGPPFSLGVQILDPAGRRGNNPVVRVNSGFWSRLGGSTLLMSPGGGFVLAWHGARAVLEGAPVPPSAIQSQAFSGTGVPLSGLIELVAAGGIGREAPVLVPGADGGAFAVWQEGRAASPPACFSAGIAARRLIAGCENGPGRLCLGEGRFQLETTWVAPGFGGGSGPGTAVQLTRDTGYFWFFDAENVELMVKVLDGRAVNGKFWVFYGSLSNVAWRLRITDLVTGTVKNYDNPRNQLASRGDTGALPGTVSAVTAVAAGTEAFEARPFEVLSLDGLAPQAAPSHTPGEQFSGPCSVFPITTPPPTRPGLCLNDQQFEVEVTWHDPFNGGQGVGGGESLTDDSGYFWFFDPENVELVVKVLDARAVNGKYWVFYGALTNVEYDIRVRHLSGAERTYHNPPFQFRSVADTAAFTLP